MATIPKSRELVFKRSATRADIFDLKGSHFKGFTFVRISEPRSYFLIRQGAKYVIESWDHGLKPLFSGLRQFGNDYYYGDYFHEGKRALLIVKMNQDELLINLFSTYPTKNLPKILKEFPATKNPGNHPGIQLSPTEPATGSISTPKLTLF